MWKTGYEGQVVDDKISRYLLPDLGLSWALFTPKPRTLIEWIAALRELGHTHERYHTASAYKAPAQTKKSPSEEKNRQPRAREEASSSSVPRKASGGTKDRAVELKGIPSDILEERRKAEICLKVRSSGTPLRDT